MLAARQVIGPQIAREERPVVAAFVVVRDVEIAIDEQTVRDHQEVWLVAGQAQNPVPVERRKEINREADGENCRAADVGVGGTRPRARARRIAIVPATAAASIHRTGPANTSRSGRTIWNYRPERHGPQP